MIWAEKNFDPGRIVGKELPQEFLGIDTAYN
jgi:hypothetical protein